MKNPVSVQYLVKTISLDLNEYSPKNLIVFEERISEACPGYVLNKQVDRDKACADLLVAQLFFICVSAKNVFDSTIGAKFVDSLRHCLDTAEENNYLFEEFNKCEAVYNAALSGGNGPEKYMDALYVVTARTLTNISQGQAQTLTVDNEWFSPLVLMAAFECLTQSGINIKEISEEFEVQIN